MTHEKMQDALATGIERGVIYAIERDGELKFFHRDHIGASISQAEADSGISAAEYRRLSNDDRAAWLN